MLNRLTGGCQDACWEACEDLPDSAQPVRADNWPGSSRDSSQLRSSLHQPQPPVLARLLQPGSATASLDLQGQRSHTYCGIRLWIGPLQCASPFKILDYKNQTKYWPIFPTFNNIRCYFRHQNPIGDGAMPASDLCARNPPKLRALAWQAPANQRRLHVSQGTWKFSASEPTTPEGPFLLACRCCSASCPFSPSRNFATSTLQHSRATSPRPQRPPLPPTNHTKQSRGGIGPPRAALDLNESYMTGSQA